MKLADRLRGLHKQATTEKTHFYVGSLAQEAADALDAAERILENIVRLGDAMSEHPMPNTYAVLEKVRADG